MVYFFHHINTLSTSDQRWFTFSHLRYHRWFTFSIYTTKTNDFQILTIFSPNKFSSSSTHHKLRKAAWDRWLENLILFRRDQRKTARALSHWVNGKRKELQTLANVPGNSQAVQACGWASPEQAQARFTHSCLLQLVVRGCSSEERGPAQGSVSLSDHLA